jgi:hypothetical protein
LHKRDSEYGPAEEREIMQDIGLDPDRQAELRKQVAGDRSAVMDHISMLSPNTPYRVVVDELQIAPNQRFSTSHLSSAMQ